MSDIAIRDEHPLAESPVTQALSMIERAAVNPAVDIVKMQALQEMQFRLLDRYKVEEWHEAVSALPAIRVKKNGTISLGEVNGKSRGAIPFAKWEDMDTVLRPILEERSLFLTFDSSPRQGEGGGLIITGALRHRHGHFLTASIPLPMDTGPGRNNLQAYGSTLSYGKRYTAEMLLNIVREGDDDDGKLGGTKRITEEQADELREWSKEIGRIEGQVLDQFFAGAVRSFDEIEVGQGYLALRGALKTRVEQQRSAIKRIAEERNVSIEDAGLVYFAQRKAAP